MEWWTFIFFGLFVAFISGVFVLVIGGFVFLIGFVVKAFRNSISEKRYNDTQPVLTKDAKVTAKRTKINGWSSSVSTNYYGTFEFPENKERLELEVAPEEYGLLAEGDAGQLKFQGRRYLNFQRKI